MFHYALSSRCGMVLVFFACLIFSSFHTQDDLVDKIASSLSTWTGERPQEKVYLHTDKPYYALPLTAGMSIGDFTLSDTLKEGNYRLRAYTRWMRNAGADYFFDHTFAVGNPGSGEVMGKVTYEYKITAGKPVVTALLNYTDASGLPLADKEVRYEIMANHEAVASEKAKTDAS